MTGFDSKGRQPSKEFPLGNPSYGQTVDPSKPGLPGTAGGGPNYIDHLVATYNDSLVLSYNYAVGGTVVSTSVVHGSSPDLQSQVQESFAKTNLHPYDDSLFLIFMGDNDVQGSYKTGTPVVNLMEAYFSAIDELYKHNARNFLLVTVPQLNRSPSHNLTHDTAEENLKLAISIAEYNVGLRLYAESWMKAHSDVHFEIYDFNAFMGTVLDQPSKFGFDDATCVGSGPQSRCVWWKPSDEHTTSKFQDVLAKDMSEKLKKYGW